MGIIAEFARNYSGALIGVAFFAGVCVSFSAFRERQRIKSFGGVFRFLAGNLGSSKHAVVIAVGLTVFITCAVLVRLSTIS